MSVRHTELVDAIDEIHASRRITTKQKRLLEQYAEPHAGAVEDQLDAFTVGSVEALTGKRAWTPGRAARALLSTRGL